MTRQWFALLLLVPGLLFGQEQNFKKVASAGYVFLMIPVGARTAGMSESSVALTDLGAEAAYVNPGLLSQSTTEHQAFFSYSKWIAETNHQALAYSYNAGDLGTVALSVVRLDYGSIPGYRNPQADKKGEYLATGDYTADAIAVGLSYGRILTERFSFGLTAKYVQERIDIYRSNNVVFDGGFVYRTGFHSLRIAGVVRNFGVESKYLEGLFKMPTDLRFGLALDLLGSPGEMHLVTAAVEMLHPTDNVERVNVAMEYRWNDLLALRGGYKFSYDEETWSAGFGLRYAPVDLDLAAVEMGRLGTNVRFSILLSVN